MKWHVLLALATALPVSAQQVPKGYHLGERAFLPDSLVEVNARGQVRISIVRTARTESERQMLLTAERLYPDSATIVQDLEKNSASGYLPLLKQAAALRDGDRWWFIEDGARLPYAITGRAIKYYMDYAHEAAERLSSQPPVYRNIGAPESPSGVLYTEADVRYTATVSPADSASASYVVHMLLSLTYRPGFQVRHQRYVFFDKRGNVIRVERDGMPYMSIP